MPPTQGRRRRRSARIPALFLAALLGVTGCAPEAAPTQPSPGAGSNPASSPASGSVSGPARQPGTAPRPLPVPVQEAVLATGLDTPWSVTVLPGGNALVSERGTGRILSYREGRIQEAGVLPEVRPGGEGGLLGLAVGPGFTQNRWVYAYLTTENDNRVVRMPFDGTSVGPREVLLEGIPKARNHNGGRLAVGPDGMLYIGTGDAQQAGRAQDPESLAGKILRLAPDGGPAADNPFPGSPVYSLGHRNVQGLDWDAQGRLWATEFGPDVDDELNLIEPGANYGWPEVTGAPGDGRFRDAKAVWPSTADASPSGLAVLSAGGVDTAYVGGLRGRRLWQVPLNEGTAGTPVPHFRDAYGRIRDVVPAPGGGLWLLTNEDRASRLVAVSVK